MARSTWEKPHQRSQTTKEAVGTHEEMRSNRFRSNAHADDSIDLHVVWVDAVQDVDAAAVLEDVREKSNRRRRKDNLHRRQEENLRGLGLSKFHQKERVSRSRQEHLGHPQKRAIAKLDRRHHHPARDSLQSRQLARLLVFGRCLGRKQEIVEGRSYRDHLPALRAPSARRELERACRLPLRRRREERRRWCRGIE